MIQVRYFASFRERLGSAGEELAAKRISQVADLLEALRARGGVWQELFAADQPVVMVAVNQEMADPSTPVQDGDEVALFPPVTGG